MRGTGQPLWAHACDGCERISKPSSDEPQSNSWSMSLVSKNHSPYANSHCQFIARLTACVMDGVTVGHPRCNKAHCTERLQSTRDRFCRTHSELSHRCAMDGCTHAATTGFRTCEDATHRGYELEKRAKGQAVFRLRRRAEKAAAMALERASGVVDSSTEDGALGHADVPADTDELDDLEVLEELEEVLRTAVPVGSEEVLDSAEVADILSSTPRVHHSQASKPAEKKAQSTRLKTTMYRKWTHNEQLMVRCCGIILSRATFYESEGPANALVSKLLSVAVVLFSSTLR